MNILLISAHFKPNIGGVETHLTDLVEVLVKKKWEVLVLTYKPLTTKISSKFYEKMKLLTVIRLPWFPGLFYKLVRLPLWEFLYLLPGLFFATPVLIIIYNPSVIHANGLVAGFIGIFWGKIFKRKVVISTHSIYSFPKQGLYKDFVSFIFRNATCCLGLSKQATEEIKSLGVDEAKVKNFTYWINLQKFKRIDQAKSKLGWKDNFIILFVGRLVTEKGVKVLLESVKNWDKHTKLAIIGSGPLEDKVREVSLKLHNVSFIGRVDPENLPIYYSGSDLLIVPSISEEGFGRVILESLACGTPVIGAKRGAIPEALDKSVGKLIDISTEKITEAVGYFYKNRGKLEKLAGNCRKFAERKYSEKNADVIIESFNV